MTPEEKSLLESTHQLAKDNNELLRKLLRSSRISTGLKVGYWVLIIALSFGALYFIQPYFDMLKGLTGNSKSNTSSYSQQIQDLLK